MKELTIIEQLSTSGGGVCSCKCTTFGVFTDDKGKIENVDKCKQKCNLSSYGVGKPQTKWDYFLTHYKSCM